jgi:SAM-dependent methyltransferase
VLGANTFDLVYTGIGALCWLPDIARWARVVAGLLRPGGRLFVREGHPMLRALDEHSNPLTLRYSYFNRPEPLIFDDAGTYVDTDATFTSTRSHEWNHGIGEVVTAVLGEGLRLTELVEHDSVPLGGPFPGRWSSMTRANGGWPSTHDASRPATRCRPSRADPAG